MSDKFPETVPSILSSLSQRQLAFPNTKGWKKKRKPQTAQVCRSVPKATHANPRCPFENCNLCRKTHGAAS